MRIAFCADVHLGNHRTHGGPVVGGLNRRCKETLDAFGVTLSLAAGEGAEVLVVLGDLYDGCRPEPQLIAEVQRLLAWAKSKFGLKVVVLLGNHDMQSNEEGDHALGPLNDYAFVAWTPLTVKVGDSTDLLCVPFHPSPSGEWFEKVVKHLAKTSKAKTKLLCLHLGIADDETPEWLRDAPDSVHVEKLNALMADLGIVGAFAGNWHEHIVWEGDMPPVVQVGALVPTGWDNPGLDNYGRLVVADTTENAMTFLDVPGPRFMVVTGLAGLEAVLDKHKASKNQFYLRVRGVPEDVARIKAAAEERSGKHKVGDVEPATNLRACEVVVDTGEAQAAARTAAQSARSADTLSEALGKFVGAMPLKDGVDRGAVLVRCQKYLGVSQ